jgi:beta-N-acetylhexosaminidase
VARLGAAFIRGTHAAGVLATGKHFPGHGDTALDSHVARPVSERSVAQMEACELLPFRAAIQAGLGTLMTAHVRYPAWDAAYPATLSRAVLTGVLRGQLGFAGAIATDDLGMQAVADAFPWEEVPRRALQAGADLLLVCHHRQRQEQAYTDVLRAVHKGELSETRVEEAFARVHALKARLIGQGQAPVPTSLACIGSAEHCALAAALAREKLYAS